MNGFGASSNVDPAEIGRFEALASRWWNPHGEFRALHAINPLRLAYISERAPLAGSRIVDVGCGGGLLAEAMAGAGGAVTGIDMAETALAVARAHAAASAVELRYELATAEQLAAREAGHFDVVTCLELLEHVPQPGQVVAACARLARPGGNLFFSTINRNPKSFLFSIVGAEYVLGLLPRGTHEYERFIRPSELASWARLASLEVADLTGLHYDPFAARYSLGGNVDVNYLMHCRRKAE
ncbi:MAG: bifunctional 2-polyprenyl-6-hydroxyphenol methylase/3-demethylubiquinol 3-O-methyltransferase UbiG [Gammaproteobacteria bacterium]|nr:bifunctional 2-polyprenyl-6-hydroxyphenol methylase/3-demethylubiquinol 3-O-methyltransferase UbiG [Gammaproteobacteria bacterium]